MEMVQAQAPFATARCHYQDPESTQTLGEGLAEYRAANPGLFSPEELERNESLGHLSSARFKDPSKSLSGYVHPLCALFMIESMEIRQADGFEFIDAEHDLLEDGKRHSSRLEDVARRFFAHFSAASWSGHG